MIHQYLFVDSRKRRVLLTDSLRKFELYKWFSYFSYKVPELSFEKCIETRIAKRVTNFFNEDKNKLKEIELTELKNAFITKEKTLIFYIKLEKGYFYLTKDDLAEKLDNERMNNLNDLLKTKIIIPKFENTKEETYLFRNYLKKYNSSFHSKLKNQLKWDLEKNKNNCLLYTLNQLYDLFPYYKFKRKFLNQDFNQQISLINATLKMNKKKELKYLNVGKHILKDYIKTIKNVTIIIFYDDFNLMHSEIVINRKIYGQIQNHIDILMNKLLNILQIEMHIPDLRNKFLRLSLNDFI